MYGTESTAAPAQVRAQGRSISPRWGSTRFRPPTCTYDAPPRGPSVRVDGPAKSRNLPTPKSLNKTLRFFGKLKLPLIFVITGVPAERVPQGDRPVLAPAPHRSHQVLRPLRHLRRTHAGPAARASWRQHDCCECCCPWPPFMIAAHGWSLRMIPEHVAPVVHSRSCPSFAAMSTVHDCCSRLLPMAAAHACCAWPWRLPAVTGVTTGIGRAAKPSVGQCHTGSKLNRQWGSFLISPTHPPLLGAMWGVTAGGYTKSNQRAHHSRVMKRLASGRRGRRVPQGGGRRGRRR